MNNTKYVCNVGPVQIYEVESGSFLFKNSVYFWKLADNPQAFGPFYSVVEALRDWEIRTQKPKFNNVIHVDFKAKKRIT